MDEERKLNCGTSSWGSCWWICPLAWSKIDNMCDHLATGCFVLIKRKSTFAAVHHTFVKKNKDLGLSWTTLPPPSSRCKAQSCRCKPAHSITRKTFNDIKWYLFFEAYLNSFEKTPLSWFSRLIFKIASHPSTYPINALLTPRFLLHWTAPHLNMCALWGVIWQTKVGVLYP